MTRVLIVEDTPNFRRWLLHAVPRLVDDCEVQSAADAAAAEAQVLATTPDVILLDLGLPKDRRSRSADPSAGIGLLRTWRERGLESHIVVLSSHADLAQLCSEAGADGFLAKDTPGLFDALRAVVRPSRPTESVLTAKE